LARHEADRDDLFAETRGIVPRIEFPFDDSIGLVGRKREGGLVVYLGQDRMLGFSRSGGLRRALADGLLFKAAAGRRLVRIRRDRSEGGHVLLESELSAEETAGFLETARLDLGKALAALRAAPLHRCRMDPGGADGPERAETVRTELATALEQLLSTEPVIENGL
jgi:hypothetical protein